MLICIPWSMQDKVFSKARVAELQPARMCQNTWSVFTFTVLGSLERPWHWLQFDLRSDQPVPLHLNWPGLKSPRLTSAVALQECDLKITTSQHVPTSNSPESPVSNRSSQCEMLWRNVDTHIIFYSHHRHLSASITIWHPRPIALVASSQSFSMAGLVPPQVKPAGKRTFAIWPPGIPGCAAFGHYSKAAWHVSIGLTWQILNLLWSYP